MSVGIRDTLRRLYLGADRKAAIFQYALLTLDIITLVFFIVVTFLPPEMWIALLEFGLGVLLLLDLVARFLVAARPLVFLSNLITIFDILVVISLLISPFTHSLGLTFMRFLRALRLLRSYHILGELRRRSRWVREREDLLKSAVTLGVFIFATAAFVYVTQSEVNPEINHYGDALYFTVTTLTTTGFGDITLVGDFGRFIAIGIMVFGLAFFLRLLQAVFRPTKVRFNCAHCGLSRHDPDAVHCKHCGAVVNIPTEGEA